MTWREGARSALQPTVLFTCEHGGNRVPARYASYFDNDQARAALASHRGHDPGAILVARWLSRQFQAPLISSTVTRLLIDLNRSSWHKQLWSEFSLKMPAELRQQVLAHHYHRHRNSVEQTIARYIEQGATVLHIAVHSFVPALNGNVRQTDIGLLYDPRQPLEREQCNRWQQLMLARRKLRVRRNYPYQGNTDGLTTALRKRFSDSRYLGVELELNQAILSASGSRREASTLVGDSLRELIGAPLRLSG